MFREAAASVASVRFDRTVCGISSAADVERDKLRLSECADEVEAVEATRDFGRTVLGDGGALKVSVDRRALLCGLARRDRGVAWA